MSRNVFLEKIKKEAKMQAKARADEADKIELLREQYKNGEVDDKGNPTAAAIKMAFPANVSSANPTWVKYTIYQHLPVAHGGEKLNGAMFNVGVNKQSLASIALSSDAPVTTTENQGWKQEAIGGMIGQLSNMGLKVLTGGDFGDNLKEALTAAADVPGNELHKLTSQQKGVAMVEKMALKYDGPEGQRSFTMTHIFVPRNLAESKMAKKIIKTFREHSAPRISASESSSLYTSYKFPSLFKVEQMMGEKINMAYPMFHTCYCKSVTSKFGDASNNTFAGSGMPTTMEISLQFEEIGISDRNKIEMGY
ncbi:MAG: hypothetical protein ABGW56_00520 [Flavobacteriaceae bacterium]|jgi:hypothetical protein